MAQLRIELSGQGPAVMRSVCDLFGSNTLIWGEPKEIVSDATITLLPMVERRSGITHDAAPTIEIILAVVGPVALNLVSSYIYDKLKTRKDSVKLTINRRVTELDAQNITRVIEEEIKYEQRG
jgi:hypothetical protein